MTEIIVQDMEVSTVPLWGFRGAIKDGKRPQGHSGRKTREQKAGEMQKRLDECSGGGSLKLGADMDKARRAVRCKMRAKRYSRT